MKKVRSLENFKWWFQTHLISHLSLNSIPWPSQSVTKIWNRCFTKIIKLDKSFINRFMKIHLIQIETILLNFWKRFHISKSKVIWHSRNYITRQRNSFSCRAVTYSTSVTLAIACSSSSSEHWRLVWQMVKFTRKLTF